MTAKELIEQLKKIPEDTVIKLITDREEIIDIEYIEHLESEKILVIDYY